MASVKVKKGGHEGRGREGREKGREEVADNLKSWNVKNLKTNEQILIVFPKIVKELAFELISGKSSKIGVKGSTKSIPDRNAFSSDGV